MGRISCEQVFALFKNAVRSAAVAGCCSSSRGCCNCSSCCYVDAAAAAKMLKLASLLSSVH